MKIKYKLSINLSIILVILGIVLNLSIRYVLNVNMENNISSLLDEVMNSTRESIKYRLSIDTTMSKEELLKQQAEYINNYISLNYDCKVNIKGIDGTVYYEGIDSYKSTLQETVKDIEKGKAIVNLMYTHNGIEAALSYPIYVNDRILGLIDIIKDYNDIYKEYKNMINIITFIEVIILILVLIVVILMTNAITKPISLLTKEVKRVGDDNYKCSISITKGKDEVSILSNEFIKMQEKIKEQIEAIKIEKEKVETLAMGRKKFFDNVTHEIKTPLTAIIGYAEMVKDNIVDDEEFMRKAIERIYSESERLNLLVLNLINVSKGLSAINENKVECEMKDIIEQICGDMRIKCNKYGLNIIKNIESGVIIAQVNKIRELIINILDNAIKYSLNDENIIVNCKNFEKHYCIEVINKSEPIPDDIYINIYEPLVKNNKEEYSSGLGLYLCKEIVDEHNGKIEIINGNEVKVKIMLPKY